VIVVASPELSAVKSAADSIDILDELGTPHDRLSVVLNNRTEKPAVSKPAVERMLKRDIDVEIAFDGSRPEQAAVEGVILSLSNPRSEMARGCEALAAMLEAKHGRPPRVNKAASEIPVPAGRGE
jgi:MinD-like ATPase involved in chromosome partitioning or flagellar assembly